VAQRVVEAVKARESKRLFHSKNKKTVADQIQKFAQVVASDADTAAAISGMLMLAAIARGDQTAKDSDTVSVTAPDKIAHWVVTLNEWRLANYQPLQGLDPGMSRASTKRSAVMIPVRVAQEKNTRNAADSTNRRHCGAAHRMVIVDHCRCSLIDTVRLRYGRQVPQSGRKVPRWRNLKFS
jgi:hypothetical protein